MGLLIHGSCVLGYAKVKRTLHLGFTPAYIALMSAVYWLLRNKWAVYCKCGLAARLCVMYSLTCIVLAVSLMYSTFTVSKVIVMRITLQKGVLQYHDLVLQGRKTGGRLRTIQSPYFTQIFLMFSAKGSIPYFMFLLLQKFYSVLNWVFP